MNIYIDADACPVTRIAERVAREHNIPVVLDQACANDRDTEVCNIMMYKCFAGHGNGMIA